MLFVFPSKEIEKEDAKICELYLASDIDMSLDEFIEIHGTEEYKRFYKEMSNQKIDMTADDLVMA